MAKAKTNQSLAKSSLSFERPLTTVDVAIFAVFEDRLGFPDRAQYESEGSRDRQGCHWLIFDRFVEGAF